MRHAHGRFLASFDLIMSYIAGWMCIGLTAALVAGILPFRRGVLGVTLNASAGVLGAVGAALLAVALGLSASPRDPMGLLWAGLGALALLVIVHGIWNRMTGPPTRA